MPRQRGLGFFGHAADSRHAADNRHGAAQPRFLANAARPRARAIRNLLDRPGTAHPPQVKPLINETKGMNKLITMKPTATPRNTIISGSISAVSESVKTRTSSS